MIGGNAHSVIAHIEDAIAALGVDTALPNLNTRFLLIAHELGSVVQQVLQHFHQTWVVSIHIGQTASDIDCDPAFHNATMDQVGGFTGDLLERYPSGLITNPA